jgi:hypothetical protein
LQIIFLLAIKPDQSLMDAALKYDALSISDSEFIFLDQTKVGYLEKKDLITTSNYLSLDLKHLMKTPMGD